MRKGTLTWEVLAKIVLGVAFLLIILYIIYLTKDKLLEVGRDLVEILKFG